MVHSQLSNGQIRSNGNGGRSRTSLGCSIKKLIATVVAAALMLVDAAGACAAQSDDEVRAYANSSFVGKWIKCGSRSFLLTSGRTLTEINEPWWDVSRAALTPADELNGIDFKGQVRLRVKAFRMFDSESDKWRDWEDQGSFTDALGTVFDDLARGAPSTPSGYIMLVRHKNGRWETLSTTVDGASRFDCSVANSIESSSNSADKNMPVPDAPAPQTRRAAPQPFAEYMAFTESITPDRFRLQLSGGSAAHTTDSGAAPAYSPRAAGCT